jgi:hypothetical protein
MKKQAAPEVSATTKATTEDEPRHGDPEITEAVTLPPVVCGRP